MKQTKHFKRTAFNLSAKSMVSLMLLLIAMLMPQGAWAGACAYTPGCASLEDMQVHLNGTNGNFNGSANNEVVASLKFNYWLDIFNYDGDNGYWDRDLTMKIDGQTLTFYSDYACTTKVSTDYSTVLHGVWGVFGDSNEDHTIGKNKSGSGNKAYFKTSSGLKGYINIYNYYAASNKWTTMKVEVFIYDLYGHKVSVCGTYKRSGKSDIAYDYVFYLGGCPRPKNVTTSRNTTQKEVTVSWQKETYSIPASDATGETRVKAYNVIDNGSWGVYRNDDYTTSIQTVGNTTMSAADDGTNVAKATCSSSPYTYNVCYEPKATYGSNGTSLKGDVTHQRGLVGSSSITLDHDWGNSGSEKDPATCTTAAVHYQTCIYCSRTSDDNHTYTSGSALGHGSTGYTESYSWTGNAYNDASQDTKACTFTLTCKKCSTKVVNGASLTCTKTAHIDALCTATGSTTYQATGSYTAANSAYNYSATKTNVYTVAALGHGSTGYTPTYTWGGTYDDATCTFTLQCGSCGAEVFNDNITTSKVPHNYVDVTCGKDGNIRWTATGSYSKAGDATYNGEAQVKDYAIPATGLHTFADDDLAQGHCTVCNHGFFRYTAEEKVEPRTPENLKDAEGQGIYDKEKHTFDGKNGVMEFDKPLVTIGEKAFFGRYQFEGDLIIPNTVTTIEKYGFNGCEGYTGNLIIPSSVTTIGEYAFCFCNFTGNLTIPNNINLGKSAFANCKGFNGTLTVSTPNIGERAFGDCSGFTELILSNSVETIGKNAFSGCSSFSGNLNIPGSVTSIGYGAFSGCSGFTGDLTIPNSVTSVASIAFRGCSGFNGNLTIPNDINKIETAVFKGCSGLTGALTIPSSVKEIGNSAFDGCAGLTGNLTIPSSVTSIEWEAFRGCSGFTGIEMNSVPQTGTDAFNSVNCTKAVVLSDDSYVYTGENPYFPEVQSATYTRRGIKNQWGTIVVPFMVNGSGDDYDLYTLTQVSDDELTLTKVGGTLNAGTPALIRLHDDLDGDYSLTLTASNTTVSGQLNEGSEANGLQLVGTYETQELNDYDYFISNNKFWRVGDMGYNRAYGVKVAPFRAYLRSTIAGSNARELSIKVEEGTLTAIEALDAITEGDAEYYDMNGRRINSLQKGVNIVKMSNGKTIKVNIK